MHVSCRTKLVLIPIIVYHFIATYSFGRTDTEFKLHEQSMSNKVGYQKLFFGKRYGEFASFFPKLKAMKNDIFVA